MTRRLQHTILPSVLAFAQSAHSATPRVCCRVLPAMRALAPPASSLASCAARGLCHRRGRATAAARAAGADLTDVVDVTATRTTDVTPGHSALSHRKLSHAPAPRRRPPPLTHPPLLPAPVAVVVLGGNGFVGSAVCRAAVADGSAVTSISRSGTPPGGRVPGVQYEVGDALEPASYARSLQGAAAVVSCVGGFGSNAAMLRVNGAANEAAVAAAKAAGVPRFVFVSVHDYNLPSFVTDNLGYFAGKRAAERAVTAAFGDAGAILRPGFIYGDRTLPNGTVLPLGAVGAPLERALASGGALGAMLKPLASLPGSDVLLAPPVGVDAVGRAAARCAAGRQRGGVYTIGDINLLASAAEV